MASSPGFLTQRLKTTSIYTFKFGSILSVVTSVVTDFLIPIADIGLIVAAICWLLVAITLLLNMFWGNKISALLNKSEDGSGIWCLPLLAILLTLSLAMSLTYTLGHKPENIEKGYLATTFPVLAELQTQTGILTTIESNTSKMVEEQQTSNVHLGKIAAGFEQLTFNEHAFSTAVSQADLPQVKAYLEASRWRDSLFYSSLKMFPFIDQLIEHNNDEVALELIKLFIDKGLLDTTKRIYTPLTGQLNSMIEEKYRAPIRDKQMYLNNLNDKLHRLSSDQSLLKGNLDLEKMKCQTSSSMPSNESRMHTQLKFARARTANPDEARKLDQEISELESKYADLLEVCIAKHQTEYEQKAQAFDEQIEELKLEVDLRTKELSILPSVPMVTSANKSLLFLAKEHNNLSLMKFLSSQEHPADGIHLEFYNGNKVVYKE